MQCPTSNPLCAIAPDVHNAKMAPIIKTIFLNTVQHSGRNTRVHRARGNLKADARRPVSKSIDLDQPKGSYMIATIKHLR